MSRAVEERNRRLLRARDTIDRSFATPLDVAALARVAHVSPAHFSRQFGATFGETPHRYLQRRRIERATELLRDTGRPVTEVCLDVGFASLGTFSRTFSAVVGESPSAYRARALAARGGAVPSPTERVPACWEKALGRPVGPAPAKSSFGEAQRAASL
jgi:AraC-like DNA-binding protein